MNGTGDVVVCVVVVAAVLEMAFGSVIVMLGCVVGAAVCIVVD